MAAMDERELALFQARMTAALALAKNARRAVDVTRDAERRCLAPYLDHCAEELERAAQAVRAAAEAAVEPPVSETCVF